NAKVDVVDARQIVDGQAEVTLNFTNGHMFVHLSEEQPILLTLQTPDATITASTAGADFIVCQNQELTCVVVKRGVVEITAEGKSEAIRAGSAGVVLSKEEPSPVICAPAATIMTWEQRFRVILDSPSLYQEISRLPQKACPV